MNTDNARRVAFQAHHGQRFNGGPYIEHVMDVVERVGQDELAPDGAVAIAWLHDVVEVSPLSIIDLRGFGATPEQEEALKAVSRRRAEGWDSYIDRVLENRVATIVKYHAVQAHLDWCSTLDTAYRRASFARPRLSDARLRVEPCIYCGSPCVYLHRDGGGFTVTERSSLPDEFDPDKLVFNSSLGHIDHRRTCGPYSRAVQVSP